MIVRGSKDGRNAPQGVSDRMEPQLEQRHCEEPSDEAIQGLRCALGPGLLRLRLAMTGVVTVPVQPDPELS